ncbi:MAG TPA: hypothetical protein VFV10_04285 [Gammaproteobacteria bacterium]|nr:hypothetical protein [Gammaproteobacteria bacterium]
MSLLVDGRAPTAAASEIHVRASATDRERLMLDERADQRIRARLRELARLERELGTLFTRRLHHAVR